MSKSKDDAPHELESQFVLRLPPVSAAVRSVPTALLLQSEARGSVGLNGVKEGITGLGERPARQQCVPADCVPGCVLKRAGRRRGGLLPSALPL